jgi:hypothetical protein
MEEIEMVKHTERVELKENAYTHRILVGDLEKKKSSARSRNGREYIINMGERGVDYFVLEYGKWQDIVSIVMVFLVPQYD